MKRSTLLAVVLIASPLAYGDDKASSKAEIEWAKGVVTDYLEAARVGGDHRQARRLLTAELRKAYEKDEFPQPFQCYIQKWEFSKNKIAPDKNEVVLEGIISGVYGETHPKVAFTVRVVKEKLSGQWRIDYFLFKK
jgi:hypothetical protein